MEKYEELFKFMNNNPKYSDKLKISIENQLWEYSTVLIWKLIIVFIYEKLYQINYVGKDIPKDFMKQLNKENVEIRKFTDFCILNDKNIYNQMNNIWKNIHGNYKAIFQDLLDNRNGLSHVNEFEEDFNQDYFENFLNKSLQLLNYLQDKHNNDYLDLIFKKISSDTNLKYLSEKDIEYYLISSKYDDSEVYNYILQNINELNYSEILNNKIKDSIISNFLNSYSFAETSKNQISLEKIIPNLNREEIIKILEGTFEFQGDNNQIIHTRGIESLFLELFNYSYNIEDLEIFWKKFVLKSSYENKKFIELRSLYGDLYGDLPWSDLIRVKLYKNSSQIDVDIVDFSKEILTELSFDLECDKDKLSKNIIRYIRASDSRYFLDDLDENNIEYYDEDGNKLIIKNDP